MTIETYLKMLRRVLKKRIIPVSDLPRKKLTANDRRRLRAAGFNI